MFNETEIEMLNDALDMALTSNKRMQNSKPKFAAIFQKIDADLNALKIKLNTPQGKNK